MRCFSVRKMSSDPKSISSGVTLPQWMRSRIEKPDDGIPFSPPSHDEFFYIRYPKTSSNDSENKSGINKLTDMLNKQPEQKPQSVDFSKHTEPCKLFLQNAETITAPIDGVKNPPKPFGTDDGFKGPSAACGSSIVKVAQLMVSGRSLSSRGFTVANIEKSDFEADNPLHTTTIEDQQHQTSELIQQQDSTDSEVKQSPNNRLHSRRGSKSLPASPLGSPKSMRKYQPNPYFTGSFALSTANHSEGRGWFLSSLLGVQREAASTTSVNEEAEDAYRQAKNNTSSSTDKTNSTKDLSQKPLKAKPSELREMNFWSPTSM